jgi:hypothetical protein
MTTPTPLEGPRYPEIVVRLREQAGAPVAMVALVRRALQKAGHHAAAAEITNLGLAAEEDEIIALAQRFVHVE